MTATTHRRRSRQSAVSSAPRSTESRGNASPKATMHAKKPRKNARAAPIGRSSAQWKPRIRSAHSSMEDELPEALRVVRARERGHERRDRERERERPEGDVEEPRRRAEERLGEPGHRDGGGEAGEEAGEPGRRGAPRPEHAEEQDRERRPLEAGE